MDVVELLFENDGIRGGRVKISISAGNGGVEPFALDEVEIAAGKLGEDECIEALRGVEE